MEMPKTIHDFGGFPAELFAVQYPAKGSPQLALETKEILKPVEVELDDTWGLDHGAWSVIKHLYPAANVPVIQLSIDYTKPPEYHFELAKQLSDLRYKGILIVGSGNIVHNLRLVDFPNFDKDNYGYDWAIEARETINNYVLEGNFKPLIEYERQSSA
jgi:4,5-DOPA dioxygenase extradiol